MIYIFIFDDFLFPFKNDLTLSMCVYICVSKDTYTHSWPSIFMDSTSYEFNLFWIKIFRKKYYILADLYYIFRPPMVASVLKMY